MTSALTTVRNERVHTTPCAGAPARACTAAAMPAGTHGAGSPGRAPAASVRPHGSRPRNGPARSATRDARRSAPPMQSTRQEDSPS
ncbi:hypothetical protein A8H35_19425 [Burkholderia thailandensis]|nr:hypothetical protein A8H31_12100 [Burkholderia thailandensis]AWY60561.1 hypothetical protein A8H35_19425 [Burkholderia thailandensis]AWY66060.1 hypothetical protein A8H36_04495 [Burkholderia thailandensis]NOK41339.1 hypothetical protein [Burkholderia thailandensis]NOK52489.1 hypothetical protein [Burkholderia thailandensis]